MRRALVLVSLWLGLAVVSTGVGLATVGVLQQRVGEAVSRPLTSAEVAAALDDASETLPAVPGLSRPTADGDDDADDRSGSPTATRAATYAPAGDDDHDQGGDATSGSTAPRPAVTADPSRSSGSSGSSSGSGGSDREESDREARPSRSPRPSSTARDDKDDEDRPSSSSSERSGRDLARSATSTRRTTTVSRLHRARVTTTPHRHMARHVLRHRVVRDDLGRQQARGVTRR